MAKRKKASCSVELARTKKDLKIANILLDECAAFVGDVHKDMIRREALLKTVDRQLKDMKARIK